MTESFPARSGNGQTYAFPPYVSGELSGRATTLRRTSGESATFGPHTAHAGRGNREPALPQLVGNAHLTEGWLLNGQRYDAVLASCGTRFFNTGFLRLRSP
jgi:hypothetical protein